MPTWLDILIHFLTGAILLGSVFFALWNGLSLCADWIKRKQMIVKYVEATLPAKYRTASTHFLYKSADINVHLYDLETHRIIKIPRHKWYRIKKTWLPMDKFQLLGLVQLHACKQPPGYTLDNRGILINEWWNIDIPYIIRLVLNDAGLGSGGYHNYD